MPKVLVDLRLSPTMDEEELVSIANKYWYNPDVLKRSNLEASRDKFGNYYLRPIISSMDYCGFYREYVLDKNGNIELYGSKGEGE